MPNKENLIFGELTVYMYDYSCIIINYIKHIHSTSNDIRKHTCYCCISGYINCYCISCAHGVPLHHIVNMFCYNICNSPS